METTDDLNEATGVSWIQTDFGEYQHKSWPATIVVRLCAECKIWNAKMDGQTLVQHCESAEEAAQKGIEAARFELKERAERYPEQDVEVGDE